MASKPLLKPGTHFVTLLLPNNETESQWKVLEVLPLQEGHIAMETRVVATFRFCRDADAYAAEKNSKKGD